MKEKESTLVKTNDDNSVVRKRILVNANVDGVRSPSSITSPKKSVKFSDKVHEVDPSSDDDSSDDTEINNTDDEEEEVHDIRKVNNNGDNGNSSSISSSGSNSKVGDSNNTTGNNDKVKGKEEAEKETDDSSYPPQRSLKFMIIRYICIALVFYMLHHLVFGSSNGWFGVNIGNSLEENIRRKCPPGADCESIINKLKKQHHH